MSSTNKYTYKLNKPAKIVNQKSGYVSTQETTPDRPITIFKNGQKMLDVYRTVEKPRNFAKLIVDFLNGKYA